MSLFSPKVIELFVFTPLLDKKGFIVGQKSLDFGPPAHLGSRQKYTTEKKKIYYTSCIIYE
jgi:hypothetical protein